MNYTQIKEKADKGNVKMQYKLAYMYLDGDQVEKNLRLSFEYFLKAAEQGHVKAQHKVGSCYYFGKGTEGDFIKAFEWYVFKLYSII